MLCNLHQRELSLSYRKKEISYTDGDTLRKINMSCFGCCDEDDTSKHADGGGHYMMKNSVSKSHNPPSI